MRATVVLQRCIRAFQKRLWTRRFAKIDPKLRDLVAEEFKLAKEVMSDAIWERRGTEDESVDSLADIESIDNLILPRQNDEDEESIINIGDGSITLDDDSIFGDDKQTQRRLSTLNPNKHPHPNVDVGEKV